MMQVLVLANNYLLVFAGWEGVGLASYLLIGYHHERWKAGVAAMKAFVINRAADAAMMMALFFFIAKAGSTHFGTVLASSANWTDNEITFATVFLFIGAMGKSAQFPLHIWLPDAMEGPTPVSAIIHSATMVCAGVYLIARSSFLFVHSSDVNLAIAIIGSLTSFIAATIALVENDIKRVLAYSTVSQIGFMFVALGAGAYRAALFHLFTHAFFKSLLFLGAGSIIHAMHDEQNLKHMGGLRTKMPVTFATMSAASLALSAIPGFAGFFSKDAILAGTRALPSGSLFLFSGLATSFLTAAYSARLMFLAFFGEPVHARRMHESPRAMLAPMIVLSIGCVVAGWVGPRVEWREWPLMLLSTLVAAAGIWLARKLYLVSPARRVALTAQFRPLIELLRNRWYIDALYEERLLNGIVLRAARAFTSMDTHVVDGATRQVSALAVFTSRVFGWFDRCVVDGLVRSLSAAMRFFSLPVRAIQTGFVQTYALLFITGLLAALGYYLSHTYFNH